VCCATRQRPQLRDAEAVAAFQPGQALDIGAMFKEGDAVDVAGTSVGKGFQGSIKRWGMKRGAMTHGSKSHREHGSTGPGTTPGRNWPGLKMAGHMGAVRRKSRSLVVLKVDTERRAIVVRGSVPGKAGNILEIAPAKVRAVWQAGARGAAACWLVGQRGRGARRSGSVWRRRAASCCRLPHSPACCFAAVQSTRCCCCADCGHQLLSCTQDTAARDSVEAAFVSCSLCVTCVLLTRVCGCHDAA
jgi:hypothetical protein